MKIIVPYNVKRIINQFNDNNYEAYMVGGCVRDMMLNNEPKDYDITTNAEPEEIVNLFPKVILTGIKHGTVTVCIDHENYEVTTYRTDGEYEDNRHPKNVVFVKELKEDLARRDFTINAMAYNEQEGLKDYFNGRDDLKNKTIKTVGDPYKRFSEDALRMLRAIRFSAQLKFKIEANTFKAICELKDNIKNISCERIREEFNKILLYDPSKIDVLRKCGILEIIIDDIDKIYKGQFYKVMLSTMLNVKSVLYIRLAAMFQYIGKLDTESEDDYESYSCLRAEKILKKLKYDNNTINKVIKLIKYHKFIPQSKKQVKKILNVLNAEMYLELLNLQKADTMYQSNNLYHKQIEKSKEYYEEIIKNKECYLIKNLKINGKDLMQFNLKGKQIGETLEFVLDKVMEDSMLNEKDKLLMLVQSRIN